MGKGRKKKEERERWDGRTTNFYDKFDKRKRGRFLSPYVRIRA
jgi:hypothetical protein